MAGDGLSIRGGPIARDASRHHPRTARWHEQPTSNRFPCIALYSEGKMPIQNTLTAGGAVIFNPLAGRGQGARLVADAKQALGPDYIWIPTQRAGHAVELAAEAAKQYPTVIAFGGDGTVGDVVRGIHGSRAILGILPVGTGNDVARNLRLPLDVTEAARVIHEGSVMSVDVGTVNGVPFINNAGTGFDARVMQTMNTGIRFVRGRPAFLLAILKTIFTYKPFHLTMAVDSEEPVQVMDAMLVSVLNGRVYGAGMLAAPEAKMDDGRLDVLVIRNVPRIGRLSLLNKLQHGDHLDHPSVSMFRCESLSLRAMPPQAMNIDGEVRGLTPVDIGVHPRSLQVLVR